MVQRMDAVVVDGSVNVSSVWPFLTKNQHAVFPAPIQYEGKPCYVLRSETTHDTTPTALKNLREKTRMLSESLKAPVYVVGNIDSLAHEGESLLNWLGEPVEENRMPLLSAVVGYLIALSNKPLLAIASTSHILRSVGEEVLGEPERLANALKEQLGFSSSTGIT